MKPLQLAVLAGVLGLITQAQATFIINSSVTGGALSGVNYANFDNLTLGGVGGVDGGITVSFTPDAKAVQGSSSGVYAAPFLTGANGTGFGNVYDPVNGTADATTYLTTGSYGSSYSSANVTLIFPSTENYLGLLWGSVDTYNTLTFYKSGNVVGTVTGTDVLNPANGYQQYGGTAYVNITGVAFDKVVAKSSQYAFEFDNVAYGVVPEPTTLISGALLLLPFAASMVRVLRRNQA